MMTTLAMLLLGAGATITLPAEAKVSGTEMELGDIAAVTSEDQELLAELQTFDLGYAPAPGYHRTLRMWKIQQDLERAFPEAKLQFAGEPVMRVLPHTATIGAGEIELAARKAITEAFGDLDLRISLKGRLADTKVPLGEKSRKLEVDLEGRQKKAGVWSVPVRVVIDGEQYSTIWAPMVVEVFRELPVLKHKVVKGEAIVASDYSIERVLVTTGMKSEPLEGGPKPGAIAARNLDAGKVLYSNDIEFALYVLKDAVASLEARNGSVQIDVTVIVLEDGHLGDRVRVRSLSGDKEVTALVTGKNRLEFNLKTDGPVTRRNVRN